MEVIAFFLADHAEAINGKLYVHGGCWDRLTVSETASDYGPLSLAVALRVPWQATNQRHTFEVSFVDADGQVLLPPFQGEFEAGRPPGMRPGDEHTLVLAVNMNAITVTSPGYYAFLLAVNGAPAARAPFRVVSTSVARTG